MGSPNFALKSERYGEKTQSVLAALREGGHTAYEIAVLAKCSIPLVYAIARVQGLKVKKGVANRPNHNRPHRFTENVALAPHKKGFENPAVGTTASIVDLRSPITYTQQKDARTLKEDRLRAELASQLEEIFARQHRIWGEF